MDNFQRTEETGLCLWSGKKKSKGEISVASKLVCEKSAQGKAVGGDLSGGPAEAPTPHLS